MTSSKKSVAKPRFEARPQPGPRICSEPLCILQAGLIASVAHPSRCEESLPIPGPESGMMIHFHSATSGLIYTLGLAELGATSSSPIEGTATLSSLRVLMYPRQCPAEPREGPHGQADERNR